MSVYQERKFLCIAPSEDLLSTSEGLYELLNSHDWKIDKVEVQSPDQIFSRIHCAICGLERVFIVSNIESATMKAAKIRDEQNNEKHENAKLIAN